MKVHDCIFFQLTKASLSGSAFWSKQVEHLGITASQAMVLNFLGEEDQISPHTLRQKLKITSATMTGILDRLENIGLIKRQPHPADRRAILICLTDKGSEYAKDINKIMLSANDKFLEKFNAKDLNLFRRMLKQMQQEINTQGGNG